MTQGPGNGDADGKPNRKVAETRLEIPGVSIEAGAPAPEPPVEPAAPQPAGSPAVPPERTLKKTIVVKKISRSFEPSPQARTGAAGAGSPPGQRAEMPASTGAPEMPPPPPASFKTRKKVAKTMLDHSILWDTVAKAASDLEVKAAREMARRAGEPGKIFQPISQYKKAASCPMAAVPSSSRERCSFCEKCLLHVYDFSGMELAEAEELIFKRENRRGATLYKRADGKFLTRDCPVGVKSRRQVMLASVGGGLIAVCLLAALILAPKPPKPAVVLPPATGEPKESQEYWSPATPGSQPAAQPQSAGSPAAQPAAPAPAAGPGAPAGTATGSKEPSGDADASQYWEYNTDQPVTPALPAQTTAQPGAQTQPSGPAGVPVSQSQLPAASPEAPARSQAAPAAAGPGQPVTGTSQPPSAPVVQYYGR